MKLLSPPLPLSPSLPLSFSLENALAAHRICLVVCVRARMRVCMCVVCACCHAFSRLSCTHMHHTSLNNRVHPFSNLARVSSSPPTHTTTVFVRVAEVATSERDQSRPPLRVINPKPGMTAFSGHAGDAGLLRSSTPCTPFKGKTRMLHIR
jgi:hypothetical protein